MAPPMKELSELGNILRRIDGRGYKAYKDLQGGYATDDFELHIDHVQGDPFAAPSRLRVIVPHAVANFDPGSYDGAARRCGLADLLVRAFARACTHIERRRGSGRSGMIDIDGPGQQVLERTACTINSTNIEFRFSVGLPASGRRVLGREAAALLLEDIPDVLDDCAFADAHDPHEIERHVKSIEDQRALRHQLRDNDLVGFIANGSILPRRSGIDQRPMSEDDAVPFVSPKQQGITLTTPNRGNVLGMGIRAGVTLIVGGGYHGKSTLLRALELGIYDHVPGDGRELVVSDSTCVKIRAEDGRRVERVDISPFISNLPGARNTTAFCSEDASGSTSQAANVIESLEAGARVLLIDEDTAATNFMIRDQRMQALIAKHDEPITPFVDKVRQLQTERRVSTVLVVGGSGDYFDVADTVIAMHGYVPEDVTARAKAIARSPTGRANEGGERFGETLARHPLGTSVDPSKGRREKISARDMSGIQFGEHHIDMSTVGQLVERSQLRAIGQALAHARRYMDGRDVNAILEQVECDLQERGLDALTRFPVGDLAAFRRFELAAALNRLRSVKMG